MFRKGELLFIGLQGLRLVSPEVAETFLTAAVGAEALTDPATPRETLETMLRALEIVDTLPQTMETLSTQDIRYLLAVHKLKICASKNPTAPGIQKTPTMCEFLTSIYEHLGLVKA